MMQKKTDEIEKYMKDCTLCPRNCHADRMAGRLEIFPLLLLFVRDTWKKF